jgi:hypothetical protein
MLRIVGLDIVDGNPARVSTPSRTAAPRTADDSCLEHFSHSAGRTDGRFFEEKNPQAAAGPIPWPCGNPKGRLFFLRTARTASTNVAIGAGGAVTVSVVLGGESDAGVVRVCELPREDVDGVGVVFAPDPNPSWMFTSNSRWSIAGKGSPMVPWRRRPRWRLRSLEGGRGSPPGTGKAEVR